MVRRVALGISPPGQATSIEFDTKHLRLSQKVPDSVVLSIEFDTSVGKRIPFDRAKCFADVLDAISL